MGLIVEGRRPVGSTVLRGCECGGTFCFGIELYGVSKAVPSSLSAIGDRSPQKQKCVLPVDSGRSGLSIRVS